MAARKTPPRKPLSQAQYKNLLSDVQSLVQEGEKSTARDTLHAFWSVGRRLARERIAAEAGYHNSVLRNLAADSRVSLRNLQYAFRLHVAYPKKAPPADLNWSQYRALLSVRDPKEREALRQQAIEEGLSARNLAALVKRAAAASSSKTALERPTDAEYLYLARIKRMVDGDTLDAEIDLGFSASRVERLRLANINTRPLHTKAGRAAFDYLASLLLPTSTIVIKTQSTDQHGRYVAHVFYSPRPLSITECFARGHYLNEELVASGHARLST